LIFVTVGQMHPFDRLVRAVDGWALERGRSDVFAQVGVGGCRPRVFESVEMLDPEAFRDRIDGASLVVSHAGMGTILSVMQRGRPMLVMPRLARHGETRNDHQVASARAFRERGSVATASDAPELFAKLDDASTLPPTTRIGTRASDTLLSSIRSFIEGESPEVIIRRVNTPHRDAA